MVLPVDFVIRGVGDYEAVAIHHIINRVVAVKVALKAQRQITRRTLLPCEILANYGRGIPPKLPFVRADLLRIGDQIGRLAVLLVGRPVNLQINLCAVQVGICTTVDLRPKGLRVAACVKEIVWL